MLGTWRAFYERRPGWLLSIVFAIHSTWVGFIVKDIIKGGKQE